MMETLKTVEHKFQQKNKKENRSDDICGIKTEIVK